MQSSPPDSPSPYNLAIRWFFPVQERQNPDGSWTHRIAQPGEMETWDRSRTQSLRRLHGGLLDALGDLMREDKPIEVGPSSAPWIYVGWSIPLRTYQEGDIWIATSDYPRRFWGADWEKERSARAGTLRAAQHLILGRFLRDLSFITRGGAPFPAPLLELHLPPEREVLPEPWET